MIQAKRFRTFLLFATLAACCFSFLGAGCPPPGLICQYAGECYNGMILQVCASSDGTVCGFQVGATWIPCTNCLTGDCYAATYRVYELCYGYGYGYLEDSSCTDLEGCETDIEEFTEDLLSTMDDLKESY